jgi:hypothetical protein
MVTRRQMVQLQMARKDDTIFSERFFWCPRIFASTVVFIDL